MKTYKILYIHNGENSDTAKVPYQVWCGQADLGEQITCCLNWDDNRLVKTNKWQVVDVTLPDWLPAEEWILDNIGWYWAWGLGVSPDWPEVWQRYFVNSGRDSRRSDRLDTTERLALIKLLSTKKFRSEFRAKLCAHLIEWLETPADKRQYDTPFSSKQFGCICDRYVALEAKRKDNGLYYGARYSKIVGVHTAQAEQAN